MNCTIHVVFVADLLGHHSLFQVENASEYVRELETLRANRKEIKGAFVFSEIARPFVYPFPRGDDLHLRPGGGEMDAVFRALRGDRDRSGS